MTRRIRAAGGLVFTESDEGKLRVLVVHRPRYDDWSLPKGKAEPGEAPEETALREVLEETGYRCRIVAPVGHTRYRVAGGRKQVDWFAMRPLPDSTGFVPNHEVDEVRWLSQNKAVALLAYQHDKDLVSDADLQGLSRTGTIRILRHVDAGSRSRWAGADVDRPVSGKGRRQAEAIATRLRDAGIEQILSSPYQRCVRSVEPLALATGVDIQSSQALAEDADPAATYQLFRGLIGTNAVLCSHGDVIPRLVERLRSEGLALDTPFLSPKGSTWEVDVERGKLTTGRYVPPPDV